MRPRGGTFNYYGAAVRDGDVSRHSTIWEQYTQHERDLVHRTRPRGQTQIASRVAQELVFSEIFEGAEYVRCCFMGYFFGGS